MPVLLVGGDRDRFFPKAVYEQTAELIPDSTVELYEGEEHLGTLLDKRLSRNVLGFTPQQGTHTRPRGRPTRRRRRGLACRWAVT